MVDHPESRKVQGHGPEDQPVILAHISSRRFSACLIPLAAFLYYQVMLQMASSAALVENQKSWRPCIATIASCVAGTLQLRLERAIPPVARPGDGQADARRDAAAGRVQECEILLDVRAEVLLDAHHAGHPRRGEAAGGAEGGSVRERIWW